MNTAPHLLSEDRPEFERVLDEALRDDALRAAADRSADGSRRLTVGQLRVMAMGASSAISACAATEYEELLRARERERAARESARLAAVRRAESDRAAAEGVAVDEAAAPVGGVLHAVSGAGLFPVITVLIPLLAGPAALIFLLLGYLLSAMRPEPAIAAPLRTAGWLFLLVAALGVLLCTVGMVLTALRDGSGAIRASQEVAPDEVTAARLAWSAALLERGMLPFLREAMSTWQAGGSDGGGASPAPTVRGPERDGPHRPVGLGYSAPGYSSPEDGDRRPPGSRFSSPDFSSPDFTSPGHPDDRPRTGEF